MSRAPLKRKVSWSVARSRVLRKYPKAYVVHSHGGRVVLLHDNDNPVYYQESVSEAWRTALERVS